VAFAFNHQLVWILERPCILALAQPTRRSVKSCDHQSNRRLSIRSRWPLLEAAILSLPVVVWQAWTFVRPGLKRSERSLAFPFIFGSLFFFALGGLFAYFILPVGLTFLQLS